MLCGEAPHAADRAPSRRCRVPQSRLCVVTDERPTLLRVMLLGLAEIAIIAASACIGLAVAHLPALMHYFTGRH